MTKQNAQLSLFEFVVLMALLSSFAAFSIDAILPALPQIGADLNVLNLNDTQLIVSMVMLGMGLGQLFFGPMCDSFGRKPTLYLGIGVFLVGSSICMYAPDLSWMLAGRIIQGFGLGSSRVVTAALIRDSYSGRYMSRVMSFIMMVFITIPMIAPLIGQMIVQLASWKMIFILIAVAAVITTAWFSFRQPETLNKNERTPFTFVGVSLAFKEVFTHKLVMLYTASIGLVFGCFLSYLAASQAIFELSFGITHEFPKYFAIMALAFGLGAFFNSRAVIKYGTQKMVYMTLPIYFILAVALYVICLMNAGKPSLFTFIVLTVPLFFTVNVMFTNFNAMAMQHMGHVAGVGAAVIGSLSAAIGVVFSYFVGRDFDGSLTTLFLSYVILGIALIGLSISAHKLSGTTKA